MVITMAKLRMAQASRHGARKLPGPINYLGCPELKPLNCNRVVCWFCLCDFVVAFLNFVLPFHWFEKRLHILHLVKKKRVTIVDVVCGNIVTMLEHTKGSPGAPPACHLWAVIRSAGPTHLLVCVHTVAVACHTCGTYCNLKLISCKIQ